MSGRISWCELVSLWENRAVSGKGPSREGCGEECRSSRVGVCVRRSWRDDHQCFLKAELWGCRQGPGSWASSQHPWQCRLHSLRCEHLQPAALGASWAWGVPRHTWESPVAPMLRVAYCDHLHNRSAVWKGLTDHIWTVVNHFIWSLSVAIAWHSFSSNLFTGTSAVVRKAWATLAWRSWGNVCCYASIV